MCKQQTIKDKGSVHGRNLASVCHDVGWVSYLHVMTGESMQLANGAHAMREVLSEKRALISTLNQH